MKDSHCDYAIHFHMHKLSSRRILLILLKPLSLHALFQNGRLNKDGQKNKHNINKPDEKT